MNKGSIRQRKSKVAFGIRGTISLVFLISSTLKSVNIHSFSLETRMYVNAYMEGWLHSLATIKPKTLEAFGFIQGIGEHKKKKYGERFLNVIRKY